MTMKACSSSSSSSSAHIAHASMHSVRKSNSKPWKKLVVPPTPPKFYRVDKINFRDLVQKLTSAQEVGKSKTSPEDLHNIAASPPICKGSLPPSFFSRDVEQPATPCTILGAVKSPSSTNTMYEEIEPQQLENKYQRIRTDHLMEAPNFLKLNPSPSSYDWCPGTLSNFDHSTIL